MHLFRSVFNNTLPKQFSHIQCKKSSSMINHNIILLLVDKIHKNQHFQNLIWTNQVKKTNIKTKYIQLYQSKKSSKIFIHSKLKWDKIRDYRIFQSAVELGLQSHWEFSCHWWPAVRHRLSSEKCWWRSLNEDNTNYWYTYDF